jgi:succinyl-CoA synthetase beta subunit
LGERRLTPFEACARQIDNSDYRGVAGRLIEFPGKLGLLIGGGGASLTIFDAVLRHDGEPANYCEIGGNPTPDKVSRLTKLIVTQPRVEKLAVIMNVVNNTQADLVAEGVVRGIREAGKTPKEVVVMFRIPGSGEERCREILSANGIPFTDRSVTIDEAAFRAVEAMRGPSKTTEVRK